MEGDRRRGEDAGRRPARLNASAEAPGTGAPHASGSAGTERRSGASRPLRRPWRDALGRGRGPWRVVVAEASMLPSIRPGDWLLVDPTIRRWPRRGSIVVVREPDTGELAIKRVAAGPNQRIPFEDGFLALAEDEAWLTADASDEVAAAAGFGSPRDSRRYGPVPLDLLVARVFFRYAPLSRFGPVR